MPTMRRSTRSFAKVEAARGETVLTYFEFGTLGALAAFHEAKVDAVVLEVGLGGRLDAGQHHRCDCAIVASVDIDHVGYLGDTREKIGFEKAGIFRAGRPAICGDPDPPASLVSHAQAVRGATAGPRARVRLQAPRAPVGLPRAEGREARAAIPALRGAWQLKNASSALAALDESPIACRSPSAR
jgi:dihydrofolate synthase/folylpolyglutamate synthase